MTDNNDYSKEFSEAGFWSKVKLLPRSLGRKAILRVLILYCLLINKSTPGWVKAAIVGVLGYLIMPLDAIPDVIPIVGYTDDIAAVTLLFNELKDHITPEIEKKAEDLMPSQFSE